MPAASPARRAAPQAPGGLGADGAFRYARAMGRDSDERLMQRYAEGDMAAFESLYERYRQPMYGYFLRQLGDEQTASDLYQGTWERIVNARRRYRPSAPFRAWAFRIAHNLLVDHYRRQRPAAAVDPAEIPAAGTDPGDRMDQDRKRQMLALAIRQLPPEQRDALLLKLEGHLSLAEIASIFEVGRETIKSRLRYATERLKQVMR